MTKRAIKNRLKTLTELEGVSVVNSDELGQIRIAHRLHHVADFIFKWVDDSHYVGYFVDAEGWKSQAVVSLWTPLEAVKFAGVYATLVDLRSKRETPC